MFSLHKGSFAHIFKIWKKMVENYNYILLALNHALRKRKHNYLNFNFFSACMGE